MGGVPGVGKTSIAGAVARKLGINIILSGDYLREFIRPLRVENGKLLGTSVYDSWKRYGDKNRENIIKGFEAQSGVMCMGIAAAVERAEKNGESVIIESLYMNQQIADVLRDNSALAAYLYISDPEVHAKRLGEREMFTHFKSAGSRLVAQLDVYRAIMDYSVELSKSNGVKLFDNIDYEITRKNILEFFGGGNADK